MTSTASPFVRLLPRYLGWGAVLLVSVVLYVWLPYQHGELEDKLSLLIGWWRFTGEHADWVFCPLVPLASAWFAWERRALLKALPVQGHWSGLVILCLAMLSYWVGHHADTSYPGFVAFQLSVAGFILWFCGVRWMRVLMFPWLFLLFMWPVFPLEDQLAQPLRMITAGWASRLLSLMGLATINEGAQLLSAPDAARHLEAGARFHLDVAEACSGIRSLYALMMLAAVYGHIFLRGLKPRAILFLSAIPLAMLGNLVRMVLLAVGSVLFGQEFAVGRTVEGMEEVSVYHELAGYMVFAVALAGMFAISSFLEGRHLKRKRAPKAVPPTGGTTPEAPRLSTQAWRSGAVLALGGFTLMRCLLPSAQPPLSPAPVTPEMPVEVASMQSQEMPMTPAERMALNADIRLTRRAYLGQNKQMLATTVLSGNTRRGLHRPEVCLPGAGWNIVGKQKVELHLDDGREVTGLLMRMFRDSKDEATGKVTRTRALNIFWFQGWGTSTPDYYRHVFTTYFDSIFRNLNHRWALVSFYTQLPPEELGVADGLAEAKGLLDLEEFAQMMAPKIVVWPKE